MALISILSKKKKSKIPSGDEASVESSRLKMSKEAALRVAFLNENDNKVGWLLKVHVKDGGCSGNMISFRMVQTTPEGYLVFEDYGSRLCVSRDAMKLVGGSTLSLMPNKAFFLNNPNAKENCSCGKSFSL